MRIKKSVLYLLICTVSIAITFLLGFTKGISNLQDEEELANCIVKAKSEWGKKCLDCGSFNGFSISYDETYKVFLTNQCNYNVDVKTCVQEKDGSWKCYHYENMKPQKDTMEAWACKGTGKYLKWVKLAGDHELVFPTNQEVHEQYPPSEMKK